MKKVDVNASNGRYSVYASYDQSLGCAEQVSSYAPDGKAFIVIDDRLPSKFVKEVTGHFKRRGIDLKEMRVSVSEKMKTLDSFSDIVSWLAKEQAERTSPIIALGGGIVGDLTGYVASSYNRGIPFFQLPTTLLSMVDSSVGGKVAVNHDGYKNMLGNFYQPKGVHISIRALESLDDRQLRCGLAECIKHGLIGDKNLLVWIEKNMDKILSRDPEVLQELVVKNVQFKANIVKIDPTETGARAKLNLGHTFGHAIEKLDVNKKYFHGEAVSMGTVAAFSLAESLGLISAADKKYAQGLFERANLPTTLDLPVSANDIAREMAMDKKVEHGQMRLILPVGIGKTEIFSNIDIDDVISVLQEVQTVGVSQEQHVDFTPY